METQRLLFLAGLLLSSSQTEADVVNSVSDCAQFFLSGNPPQIQGVLKEKNILDQNRYKPICQTYKDQNQNQKHFSFFTLYDTTNNIPVYSAYKYTGVQAGTCRPGNNWRTEPQLGQNQASDNDYKNSGYDRGHLFPSSYGLTQRDKCSTFTLTNAVPQVPTFNQGSWNKMENCIKCVVNKYCINNNNNIEGFLATGAKPGTEVMNNRVNIPSKMWSAFCCYSKSKNKWLSSAHWGDNAVEPKGTFMETKTLNQLQQQFSGIEVFPKSQCPLDATVTEFYPELNAANNNCNCPPPPSLATKIVGGVKACYNYVAGKIIQGCSYVAGKLTGRKKEMTKY